ncbi:MAG TPA: iron chelate uptake ABC transporter family permease subunit, partial [Ktedonobacterales bacterium]
MAQAPHEGRVGKLDPAADRAETTARAGVADFFVGSAKSGAWPGALAGGRSRMTLALLGLALGLLVALALATLQGTVAIPPLTTLEIVLRHVGLWWGQPHWPAYDELILMQVRLPRALGAALVGAALGVSGALFQGLLRNPLADPLLLGTSSGAALGAVVALVIASA